MCFLFEYRKWRGGDIYIYTRARAQRLVDELKEAVIVQKDCLYSYLEESFACRDDKVYSAGTKGLALLVP
jgi:hypothetical protein